MSSKKIISIAAALFLLIPLFVCANESSSKGVISRLISYANLGSGDVFVSLPTNGTICTYGYFIDKNSNGYEGIISMLLAAYQAQTPVIITGIESSRWPGSAGAVCEIYAVEYKR